jgi:F0F1-type ATP synthase assembly protein I
MPSDNKDSKDPHQAPANTALGGFSRQIATAMELPFMLVAAVALGGLAGFFLDRWLHTKPFLMLIFGTLGFIGGLREMLRRLAKQ